MSDTRKVVLFKSSAVTVERLGEKWYEKFFSGTVELSIQPENGYKFVLLARGTGERIVCNVIVSKFTAVNFDREKMVVTFGKLPSTTYKDLNGLMIPTFWRIKLYNKDEAEAFYYLLCAASSGYAVENFNRTNQQEAEKKMNTTNNKTALRNKNKKKTTSTNKVNKKGSKDKKKMENNGKENFSGNKAPPKKAFFDLLSDTDWESDNEPSKNTSKKTTQEKKAFYDLLDSSSGSDTDWEVNKKDNNKIVTAKKLTKKNLIVDLVDDDSGSGSETEWDSLGSLASDESPSNFDTPDSPIFAESQDVYASLENFRNSKYI